MSLPLFLSYNLQCFPLPTVCEGLMKEVRMRHVSSLISRLLLTNVSPVTDIDLLNAHIETASRKRGYTANQLHRQSIPCILMYFMHGILLSLSTVL